MTRLGRIALRRVAVAAACFELGILACALVAGWLLHVSVVELAQPTWSGILWGALAAIPPLLLLRGISGSRWEPFQRLFAEVDRTVLPLFVGCSWWELALIAALAGLGEEALFRGVLQQTASRALGPVPGLLAASVLFGLVHLITPTYAVLAGVMGLYLGIAAELSGGIWVPIMAHALYDFTALAWWLGRAPPAEPAAATHPPPSTDPPAAQRSSASR